MSADTKAQVSQVNVDDDKDPDGMNLTGTMFVFCKGLDAH